LHRHDRYRGETSAAIGTIDFQTQLDLAGQPRGGVEGGMAQFDTVASEQPTKH